MGRVRKLVLQELIDDPGGGTYWQYWYGSAPPQGSTYIVGQDEQEWTYGVAELPVRHIYAWELTRGPEG
jgi:hypothetical protein